MSLELMWRAGPLPLPSTVSRFYGSVYGAIFAIKEQMVGGQSSIHATAMCHGSAGSIPGIKWKLNGSTGDLLEQRVVPWYQAGFLNYTYDPGGGGRLYAFPQGGVWMRDIDPETLSYGSLFIDGFPPNLFNQDGSYEYWLVNIYGYLADRQLLFGKGDTDYQDDISIFNMLTRRRVGRIKVPITYNNYRKISFVTLDEGHVIGYEGVSAPARVYLNSYDQTKTFSHVGRSLRPNPNLFNRNSEKLTNVDPVTKNLIRLDLIAPNKAYVWCFKQNPEPYHITPPVPNRRPRAGRRVDLVSQVVSATGRNCGNWPFTFTSSGDGEVSAINQALVSDHHGTIRLSMDCGETGIYDQDVSISMTTRDP